MIVYMFFSLTMNKDNQFKMELIVKCELFQLIFVIEMCKIANPLCFNQ